MFPVIPCWHAVAHHPGEASRTVVRLCSTRASLPPVQAGSAFASCISGPTRRSRMLRPANSQTAFRRLLSPKLRLLRYLHTRWDSYPAGTTFTGAGLPPAGITELFTAPPDHHSEVPIPPNDASSYVATRTEFLGGTGVVWGIGAGAGAVVNW